MHSPIIQKLIDLFSQFPTVGPRTAARFVFYLIKMGKEEVKEIIESIIELKTKIKVCSRCFDSFEPNSIEDSTDTDEKRLCSICSDNTRDKSIVCIVHKEVDLESIEKTNKFKGNYCILGGVVSGFNKKEKKKEIEESVSKLKERIKKSPEEIKEIILALNPTTEGQYTMLFLEREFKKLNIPELKITHLAMGLPMGGELEYADEETLISALEGRKQEKD